MCSCGNPPTDQVCGRALPLHESAHAATHPAIAAAVAAAVGGHGCTSSRALHACRATRACRVSDDLHWARGSCGCTPRSPYLICCHIGGGVPVVLEPRCGVKQRLPAWFAHGVGRPVFRFRSRWRALNLVPFKPIVGRRAACATYHGDGRLGSSTFWMPDILGRVLKHEAAIVCLAR